VAVKNLSKERRAREANDRKGETMSPRNLGAATGLLVLLGFIVGWASPESPPTARDIDRHLRALASWLDSAKTVDTFKSGNPDRPVKTVCVSWMSTLRALEKARDIGCDLFITHEPTFYSHTDDDPSFDSDRASVEKRKLLAESGMVVYRCHDVWDRVPEVGILDSWAKELDFVGKPVAQKTFYAVYEVPEAAVGELARNMASKLQPYGQEAVQLVGDPKAQVRRIAIGTGAITNAKEMFLMGADAAVITEVTYWRDVRWAQDMGFPLLIVEHSVSECPGLENLAAYLKKKFPGLRVEYFQEGCPFRLIGPEGSLGRGE
jgi:putative NIF3 family GTP cyclohydrolase 1 type 2